MSATAQITSNADKVIHEVTAAVLAATDDVCAHGMEIASAATHVVSGFLKSRWTRIPTRITGSSVTGGYGNDASYFLFVELGTRKMAGQHMGQRGADQAFPQLPAKIRSRLA